MVLVGHDAVESHLVGQGVLVVVLGVQLVGLLGVKVGVGKPQAARVKFL